MSCPHLNSVHLLGRLADDPVRRALPAGGEVVSWRLIVDRPREGGGRRTVDTLTCATFDPGVGAETRAWRSGDLLEVRGSLRRRFWSTDERGFGRYEVEVHEALLIAVAPFATA